MSRFTQALLVSPLADGISWVLMREFGYDVGAEGSGDMIDVPVGFQTDFASVPRALWWVFPTWGTYGNAAVIHDWLYYEQTRSRKDADEVFLEAMGVLGVPGWKRTLLFMAVRWFGWFAWKRNAEERAIGAVRIMDAGAERKAVTVSNRMGAFRRVGAALVRDARTILTRT